MEKPFGIILLLGCVLCFLQNAESTEHVCLWESFNATCSAGEVVFIERALFGRMRNNRCFNLTENESNCSSDIRFEIQKRYGLEDNIYFNAGSDFFVTKTPTCLERRMPFLEISYKCIKRLVNEVCITETFKATCPPGTVIVIQSAHYGRMRSSRCLYFDDRELNCYADVQPYLERLCNGSAECTIRAGDDILIYSYSSRCRGSLVPYLDVFYGCAQDIQCVEYKPPENVTVEDIDNGYRLSCTNDRNISWKIHCINNTWISETSKSCDTSKSADLSSKRRPTVETPFVTEENQDGYLTFTKIIIIASCSSGTLIIFLITVLVFNHKRRQRTRQQKSSGYVDIDEIQSKISTRYGQNASPPLPPPLPKKVSKPPPKNFPVTAALYEPSRTPTNERRRLPPDSSIYTELLHEDEQENLASSGTTITVPVNLHNVKLTLNIRVDNEANV